MMIERRRFLAAIAVLSAQSPWTRPARADQMLHWFRHGIFEVTGLSDGYFPLPAGIVAPDASSAEWAVIQQRLGGGAGSIDARANVPLIRSGRDLILVDVGGGGKFQPTEGRLASSLAQAGHDPTSVTKVLLTHAHPDHLWGMLGADGQPRYPNATYYMGRTEWDFWMNSDYRSALPEGLHSFAQGAQRDLSAIRERFVAVKDGDEVVAGIHAIATPGHTPGHLSYRLDGPEALVITGDVVTNAIVSFEQPRWRFGNDTDSEAAINTRASFVDRAATERLRLLGYHFSYPGLGRVEAHGAAYRFVPDA